MHNDHNSEEVGYEVTDLHPGIVVFFLGVLGFMVFGSVIAGIMILRGFDESRMPIGAASVSPLSYPDAQVPDGPHLQGDPVKDKEEILAAGEAHLASYGWVAEDGEMKRAHIPIDRAIELVGKGEVQYRQKAAVAAVDDTAAETVTSDDAVEPAAEAPAETAGGAGGASGL